LGYSEHISSIKYPSCSFQYSLQCRDKQVEDRSAVTKPINPLTTFDPSMCIDDEMTVMMMMVVVVVVIHGNRI
jgi:hypothetical protein